MRDAKTQCRPEGWHCVFSYRKTKIMKNKEEYMEEKNKGIREYQITALTAVLLFVAATFQIASDNVLLGVVFFGAASCFSSLAGVYREREMSEQIGAINHVENIN